MGGGGDFSLADFYNFFNIRVNAIKPLDFFRNSPGNDCFGRLVFTEFDDTISGNSFWCSVGFDDFFGHFRWFSEILGNTR